MSAPEGDMSGSEEKGGVTAPSQFRLGPDVLAKLDDLIPLFAAESDDPIRESRSSVVRKLISREHARRNKSKEKR